MTEPVAPRARTIAGWPLARVAVAAFGAIALIWSAWMTRQVVDLGHRRIVAVRLSSLVREYVAREARRGGSPEETTRRTAAYLTTLDRATKALAADGSVVLVAEATLGGSVDDRTADVRDRVERIDHP